MISESDSMVLLICNASISLLDTLNGGRVTAIKGGYKCNLKHLENFCYAEVILLNEIFLLPGEERECMIKILGERSLLEFFEIGLLFDVLEGRRIVGAVRITKKSAIYDKPWLSKVGWDNEKIKSIR